MQLDDRRVQLLAVEHRCGAALQVRDVASLICNDECALELSGILVVDAEVSRNLHGALRVLGDVAEGAVAEDRAVQGREVVVPAGNDAAHVLLHHVRVVLDSLGDGTEDDAYLQELLLEGRADALAVEDRIHGDVREPLLLRQRDAQLRERVQQLRVHLVQTPLLRPLLRPRVIDDVLEIYRVHVQVCPIRHGHLFPLPEGVETEF
mmetsp:Transcript_77650/g.217916  ORF Transcript_77650/g.217916 Transcript_77650/m.217916 type:complete len:206 (+) Transcript_77650:771-1388(+)